jgi:hypothetical protein
MLVLICAFLAPSTAFGETVLWDTAHDSGVGFFDDYGQFADALAGSYQGPFTFETGSSINQLGNSIFGWNYDAVVISVLSSGAGAYTPAEVAKLTSFVNDGGGLLIMGDNPSTPNANIQSVASAFGVELGIENLSTGGLTTSNFDDSDPLFGLLFDDIWPDDSIDTYVDTLYFQAPGQISADSPSTEIGWVDASSRALIASTHYGEGYVVTVGDASFLKNDYFNNADNKQFAINTFGLLTPAKHNPEPATVMLLGLGSLVLARRKKR